VKSLDAPELARKKVVITSFVAIVTEFSRLFHHS